jgi:outer membrane protein assembly factor BamB
MFATFCSADWPQFRGAWGNGVAPDGPIPLEWSSERHLAWKTAIPGSGWSQPVIVGGRVYLTTGVSDKPLRPKEFEGGVSDPYTIEGDKASAPDVKVEWRVICLSVETGTVIWERTALSSKPKYPIHPSSTYASETPAADERGVYAFFGTAGSVVRFDQEGKMLWKRDLGVFRQQNNTGTGSSPRLEGGMLYVQCFNEEQSFIVCLDARNGEEKWRMNPDKGGTAWNTPFLWRNERRTELIVGGPKLISSHDPATGRELWRAAGTDMAGIASVTADAQRLYFGCKNPLKGGPLYAFNAGGEGDLTTVTSEKPFRALAWQAPSAAPGMASPLIAGGCAYVINDSFVTCLDAVTGKQHFKERLPGCRMVIASPIAVGDKIVILDEAGNSVVLKAGPKFDLLGRGRLENTFWASPAVAHGALILRGVDALYCVR